ncbi:hypothetical protein BC332_23688 [Capsicum chinense]|uniref:Uncharacterized protein n=1 Tax=Capsicum annuum TaxID=4072 RepID=A0A2G2YS09_CAPAN|nr:hypothetical protein T459_23332 [Capsicum annuum]PHU07199.1 hypothetical protein BC332_23688 [Capsicum chinense]
MTTFVLLEISLVAFIAIDHHWEKAFSLFLAIVLRALVSSPKINHDMEGDYDAIGRTREPLVDPRLGQISGLAKGDARGCHSDIWSSRMREKVAGIPWN